MEKIVQCQPRKQRNTKFSRSKRSKQERMVLAEGLDPIDTNGNELICYKIIIYSWRDNCVNKR